MTGADGWSIEMKHCLAYTLTAITTMTDKMDGANQISASFQDLSISDRSGDWGAKLENACEKFWTMLGDEKTTIGPDMIDAFLDLLKDEAAFALAKLVIPELRYGDASRVENKNKQHIMERTSYMRTSAIQNEAGDQSGFDTALYRFEKDTFAEAQLYRARIAFENSRPMTSEEQKRFREWWESCPVSNVSLGITSGSKSPSCIRWSNEEANRNRIARID